MFNSKTPSMRTILAILLVFLANISPAFAIEQDSRHADIVLYIQEGEAVPDQYEAQLRSLGLRTEAFLEKWMKQWECPIERSQIFARNDDGKIRVTLVRGNVFNPGGRGALPGIRNAGHRVGNEATLTQSQEPSNLVDLLSFAWCQRIPRCWRTKWRCRDECLPNGGKSHRSRCGTRLS